MFLLISNQVAKMLILMLIAFACYRLNIIDQSGSKVLANFLLLVVNPFLIISAYQMEYSAHLAQGLLISFGLAALTHLVAIPLAHLILRPSDSPHSDYRVERYSAIYSNCGFMGIPLVSSILGHEGVLYLTAYMTVFNFFTWTHGLCVMRGKTSAKEMIRGLISPMVICCLLGMIMYFSRITLPEVLLDPIDYIAAMNTPLAMIVAGVSIAQSDLRKAFVKVRISLTMAVKLLLIPVVMLFIFRLLNLDRTILYTTLVASACPTAATGTMFALKYDCDFTYASEIYAISTVFSLATIPVVVLLAEQFLG